MRLHPACNTGVLGLSNDAEDWVGMDRAKVSWQLAAKCAAGG